MAGGKVPKTGTAHVKRSSVGDNTVQDAIFGTSGVLYTQASTLASGCNSDMIDQTNGGTRGTTPTQLSHFRGYPRPTVKINWEIIEDTLTVGTTTETFDEIWVQPKLYDQSVVSGGSLSYVGFNQTITLLVDQVVGNTLPSEGVGRVTYTFTFGAGNTYPTSTTGTFTNTSGSGSSKKWQINTVLPPIVNNTVSYVASVSTTSSDDVYYDSTDGSGDSGTLAYASVTLVQSTYRDLITPSTVCSGWTGSDQTFYYKFNSPTGWLNNVCYTDAAGTTFLASGNYAVDVSGFDYDYITVNSSGVITATGFCSGSL